MKILNLGCGGKVCAHSDVINIDWSPYLRIKKSGFIGSFIPYFLTDERRTRYRNLPSNIVVHNLANGIPSPSESVDVVYHSHMLEHLDHSVAPLLIQEAFRVLRRGGITRIVVPDFALRATEYLDHYRTCLAQDSKKERSAHDQFIAEILEQSVRKEAFGSSQQSTVRRLLENVLIGDARRRGETHQWMYDQVNLTSILEDAGFASVEVVTFDTSQIANWNSYGLDTTETGGMYKPKSLFLEGTKC